MRLVSPLTICLGRGFAIATALFTLTGVFPLVPFEWLCLPALADQRDYGSDGRAGRDGRDGRVGRSVDSQTIWATGETINLNLNGGDGDDGGDGERASHPRCSRQPVTQHNLEAADGGNGGNGGNGGDGGDGGDLTIYYTDPAQLRRVYVTAEGGRGGRAGWGGSGTDGCECDDRRWRIETCENGTCDSSEYHCQDGDDGHDGRNGQDGADGRLGRLVLINQEQPIPSETPTGRVAIATFPSQPITLSRNLWNTRTGAAALLAPGSIVDSTYSEYVGYVEGRFQLMWDFERVAQANAPGELNLAIDQQGKINVTSPDDLWLNGELNYSDGLTTYRVTGVVQASDATRLAFGSVDGRSRNFTLNVLDLAQQSDLVETQFYIRYRTSRNERRPRYTTRYEAVIPADGVSQSYNRFTLAIGRLPISGQYLSEGVLAEIELVITRSYAEKSAQQTLTWRGKI